MLWDRPKEFIKRLIIVMAFATALLTIMAGITFYTWTFMPEVVNNADKEILSYYLKSFEQQFRDANDLKQKKHYSAALDKYYELFRRMEDFGKIDRLYQMKRSVMASIVESNMKLNNNQKAREMAEYWLGSDERDVDAILARLNVLSSDKSMKALIDEEYSQLFNKFSDADKVINNYRNYLIKNSDYEKIDYIDNVYFNIASNNEKDGPYFSLSAIGYSEEKYSEKQSVPVENVRRANGRYKLYAKLNVSDLKKLRFHINGKLDDIEIADVNIEFVGGATKVSHRIIDMNESSSVSEKFTGRYIFNNDDSFLSLDVPEKYSGYTGALRYYMDFTLTARDYSEDIKNLKNNHEWQIFYKGKGEEFSEVTSRKFELTSMEVKHGMHMLSSSIDINSDKISELRIDLPSSSGLKLRHFYLDINLNNGEVKKLDLIRQQSTKYRISSGEDERYLVVTGSDPYLVVGFSTVLDIKNIDITLGQ